MLASALREMFGVQLYKNNARALLSRILSILNLDWLQHVRSVRGVYENKISHMWCSTSKWETLQQQSMLSFAFFCINVFFSALKWQLMYQNWRRHSDSTNKKELIILIVLFISFRTFSSLSKKAHSRKVPLSMCRITYVFQSWKGGSSNQVQNIYSVMKKVPITSAAQLHPNPF